MSLTKICKRDGVVVAFDEAKISAAIDKALAATGESAAVEDLTSTVVQQARQRLGGAVPTVEQIQDIVEETLAAQGLPRTAKAYILYRQRRAEVRQAKRMLGVEDELKLPVNSLYVLKKRYLLKDDDGRVCETPSALFRRVAHAVAAAEAGHESGRNPDALAAEFYALMARRDFMPNSPTLMNAGTPLGQLSACFVLPVEDSIPGIFDAVKAMAVVHQSGGGTGFSFSRLRPRGDRVQTTKGIASGPLSFMRIFDVTTDVIKQGGRRRGANMGILRCDHPDVLEFIEAKARDGRFSNFNLSVGLTDAFMEALEQEADYPLRHPRTGEEVARLQAREVFGLIVSQAWRTGDPGVIFLDAVNRANPTPQLGALEATNPCGEQPLLPWESCNLGSINLDNMVTAEGALDEVRLRETVRLAVRFLDDVIDVNRYPLAATAAITQQNRKIGLGVMGLADALIRMGLAYDSEEGVAAAERIAAALQREARQASAELARERGAFPAFADSALAAAGSPPLRNATVTSIAPTGTISIIAGCSSGIEPLFAVSFVRNVIEGSRLIEVNPAFERAASRGGYLDQDLRLEIARSGTVRGLERVPEEVQRRFVTALEIAPLWHVRMQAAFQRHCDNAVSKTINFRADASVEEVAQAYRLAHAHGCKGITVYRYGSRREQVLTFGGADAYTVVDADYGGGCPTGSCGF
jgi:ribonucleoside-diphosphate reductase alpha chain